MIAPRRAVALLAVVALAGCARPADRDPAAVARAAGAGVFAQGHPLAALERRHPGLALDAEAARAAERAGREALTAPIGQPTGWDHPASQLRGRFVALRAYSSAAGSDFREILAEVSAPSGTYAGPTLVCRRTDGRWYVIE